MCAHVHVLARACVCKSVIYCEMAKAQINMIEAFEEKRTATSVKQLIRAAVYECVCLSETLLCFV